MIWNSLQSPWFWVAMAVIGGIAIRSGISKALSAWRNYRDDLIYKLRMDIESPKKPPEPSEPEQSNIGQPANGHSPEDDKILLAILNGQREGLRFQAEQIKLLRRLNGLFRGESYDDVDDSRATEIEEINNLMERYQIPRQEAEARVREKRTYTAKDFGLGER